MRRLWPIVLLLVVAGGLAWAFRARPHPVDVGRVVRGDARWTLEEEARTRVVESYVISAPVEGRLERIDLKEGDRVEAGHIVAEIDPLPLQSRMEEMRAQIRALERRAEGVATKKPKAEELDRARLLEESARAAFDAANKEDAELAAVYEHARTEADRLRGLRRREVVSESVLESSQVLEEQARQRMLAHQARARVLELQISVVALERAVLEARLQDYDWEESVYREQAEGIEATLRATAADLERTKIPSPVAGTVLAVHRESEQVVQAGAPILEVANLAQFEIEAEFLSEDAAHMREGMDAEVFGRALGERVLKGRVLRIEPRAFEKVSSLGVEQQRVRVIVAVEAKDTGLRDRFRVEVRVVLDVRENALLVPEGALFRERGAWYVFRVREGRIEQVRVTTGIRDGHIRELLDGLAEGDEVVLYPGDGLEAGTRVEPLPGAESAAL